MRKKTAEREADVNRRLTELSERSPNPDDFRIVDYEQVDRHLVIKVRYPSCKRCSYDQCKVMVFLDVTMKKALSWMRIDPHFRAEKDSGLQAPSPVARFPASAEGWSDAIAFARSKVRPS
ncbi:MAG TPA: hypothetical protein VI653_16210 [Steroidobacteraceae bacterium]